MTVVTKFNIACPSNQGNCIIVLGNGSIKLQRVSILCSVKTGNNKKQRMYGRRCIYCYCTPGLELRTAESPREYALKRLISVRRFRYTSVKLRVVILDYPIQKTLVHLSRESIYMYVDSSALSRRNCKQTIRHIGQLSWRVTRETGVQWWSKPRRWGVGWL